MISQRLMTTCLSAARAQLLVLSAAVAIALGVASSPVQAQEEVAPAAGNAEREGSILLGVGLGPAFSLNAYGGSGFHLQLNASYAFMDRLYGVFTPSFIFGGGGTLITLPIGVQYDIEIPSVPNLYVYPRLSIGVGFFTGGGSAAFALIPEAGVKYVIQNKYFIGFEPFSLAIYIQDYTVTLYRLNFLGGIYF